MAYGIELFLAWPFENWDKLTDLKLPKFRTVMRPNMRIDFEEESALDDALQLTFERFQKPLAKVHSLALKEMGFTVKKNEKKNSSWVLANTPLGEREFAPWSLQFSFDPGEMGESAEHAIIGVAISSRYKPTFADWKDESGTLTPMVFNEELQKIQAIAKKHIVSVLPCLKKAPWIIKEIHY